MRQELLTPEIRETLPKLYEQENAGGDAIVHVKFFTPWSSWTWYVTEYDPIEQIFFGLVEGLDVELGYFSLDELLSVRGPAGLYIERDIHWQPKALKDCNRGYAERIGWIKHQELTDRGYSLRKGAA